MQSGERQFHLGLDASNSHDAAACAVGVDVGVVEESCLAYTGFATKHDHAAGPGSRIPDKPIKRFTLGTPVLQS
jgi:hypothetical protein